MKAKDVQIGKVYAVKVSGNVVSVKITHWHPCCGDGTGINLNTHREIYIKSAQRLRHEIRET